MRDLAHREGGVEAAVAHADDDALERLQALAVAFLDLDLDDDGVTWGEVRDLAGHLLLVELLNDVAHGFLRLLFSPGTTLAMGQHKFFE